MTLRALSHRLRDPDSRLLDAVLAGALLAAFEAEVLTSDYIHGPVALNALVILGMTLPLAWRRRAPLATTVTIWVFAGIEGLLLTSLDKPISAIFVLVVPAYTVARYESQRRALAGLLFGLAVAWTFELVRIGGSSGLADLPFVAGLQLVSWLTGRALRGRWLLARELEEKAERIEAEREHRARLAVADERTRIARELHGVVASSVSAMVVQAGAAQRIMDDDPERTDQAIKAIETTGRDALAEMRRILGVLRRGDGAELAPQPGIAQLPALVERGRAAGQHIELRVEGEPGPLPPGVDLAAYRILQGALANVLQHAPGSHAGVIVRYREADVELELYDDGPSGGRLVEAEAIAARERVALYGGDMTWGPRSGGGYQIRATLPRAFAETVA